MPTEPNNFTKTRVLRDFFEPGEMRDSVHRVTDLDLRSIGHLLDSRIGAQIFASILAHCLHWPLLIIILHLTASAVRQHLQLIKTGQN